MHLSMEGWQQVFSSSYSLSSPSAGNPLREHITLLYSRKNLRMLIETMRRKQTLKVGCHPPRPMLKSLQHLKNSLDTWVNDLMSTMSSSTSSLLPCGDQGHPPTTVSSSPGSCPSVPHRSQDRTLAALVSPLVGGRELRTMGTTRSSTSVGKANPYSRNRANHQIHWFTFVWSVTFWVMAWI